MDILPGQLAFLIVVATLDAAFLGWLTLRWYQRAVTRLMRQQAPADARIGADEPSSPPAAGGTAPSLARPADGGDSRFVRRLVPAYVVGALLFASITGVGTMASTGVVNPAVAATWLWVFAWPVVPSLGLLLAFDRRRTLGLVAGYLAAGAAAVAAVTLVSQALRAAIDDAPLTNIYWAVRMMLVTIPFSVALVALTAWRRVRVVMPLALAMSLSFGIALLITPRLVTPAFDVPAIRDAVLAFPGVASGVGLYYATVLLVALPLGWCAWRLLNHIALAFARKRFSDAQLVVDCWWAIVALEVSATDFVGTFGAGGLAIGGAAFLAYRAGVSAVLRATGRGGQRGEGRLLLLRVFGYQARTEAFFDAVAQRWRLRGPVHLIGAADLASRTTDPGDVLAFVDGRLGEQFVVSRADIPRRLAGLDMAPDPDGRFRVNEVYCHDGVWRETLVDLLRVTDVVVMDLRQFGPDNRGCIFELEQLFARLPPERVLLICDGSTDRDLLREVVAAALTGAPAGLETAAERSIVSVERNSRRELDAVMWRLVRAAGVPLAA